jgi:hypothetical protein
MLTCQSSKLSGTQAGHDVTISELNYVYLLLVCPLPPEWQLRLKINYAYV